MSSPRILQIKCPKCGWHRQMRSLTPEEILELSIEQGSPSEAVFVTCSSLDVCWCWLQDANGDPAPAPEAIHYSVEVLELPHKWVEEAVY